MQGLLHSLGLILAVLCVHGAPARESQLVQAVHIGEYYETVYAPLPIGDADFMFFQEEPLLVSVQIFNDDQVPHWLERRPDEEGDLAVLRDVAAGSPVGRSELRLSVSEMLEVRSPAARNRRSARTEAIELASKTSVVVTARLTCMKAPCPVGVYGLKIGSTFEVTDLASLTVNNESLKVEIRAVGSIEDRVELLRRRATRDFFAGSLVEADKLFDELLSIYPNSFVAYLLKGDIAARLARKTDAQELYKAALTILKEGRDTLYIRFQGSEHLEERIRWVQARLEAVS